AGASSATTPASRLCERVLCSAEVPGRGIGRKRVSDTIARREQGLTEVGGVDVGRTAVQDAGEARAPVRENVVAAVEQLDPIAQHRHEPTPLAQRRSYEVQRRVGIFALGLDAELREVVGLG